MNPANLSAGRRPSCPRFLSLRSRPCQGCRPRLRPPAPCPPPLFPTPYPVYSAAPCASNSPGAPNARTAAYFTVSRYGGRLRGPSTRMRKRFSSRQEARVQAEVRRRPCRYTIYAAFTTTQPWCQRPPVAHPVPPPPSSAPAAFTPRGHQRPGHGKWPSPLLGRRPAGYLHGPTRAEADLDRRSCLRPFRFEVIGILLACRAEGSRAAASNGRFAILGALDRC